MTRPGQRDLRVLAMRIARDLCERAALRFAVAWMRSAPGVRRELLGKADDVVTAWAGRFDAFIARHHRVKTERRVEQEKAVAEERELARVMGKVNAKGSLVHMTGRFN